MKLWRGGGLARDMGHGGISLGMEMGRGGRWVWGRIWAGEGTGLGEGDEFKMGDEFGKEKGLGSEMG